MAQKITIAQICPRLNSGGIERGTVDVAIAVKKAGFRSIVISGGGQLSQEIAASGVEHFELPLYLKSPLAIRRNAKQLRDIIHDWNINLVHARSRAPIWAAHHALKGSDADFVTSCHSPHGLGPLGLKKYYNRSITFGKRIIAISEYIADYLQQNYRVASDKIDVIYRGIDCTQFNPDTIDQAQIIALKNQLHIPPDKTVILLPGRITRWKGQDVFIKALSLLKDNTQLHGVIVGRVDSNDYYKELIALIDQHQLQSQIQFIEESFDMPQLYAMADITLSTSRKAEAFGRVAVEGQAMQSLVIATDLGAAKETVLPDKTGFLVAPDDPQALANVIKHVISLDTSATHQLQQQARERVLSTFNKDIMLEKTLATYDNVLRR